MQQAERPTDLFSIANLKTLLPVFRRKARDLVQLYNNVADKEDETAECMFSTLVHVPIQSLVEGHLTASDFAPL